MMKSVLSRKLLRQSNVLLKKKKRDRRRKSAASHARRLLLKSAHVSATSVVPSTKETTKCVRMQSTLLRLASDPSQINTLSATHCPTRSTNVT